MKKTIVPYLQVPQLAKTDVAYAESDPTLLSFAAHPPFGADVKKVAHERLKRAVPREDLVAVLQDQYRGLPSQEAVDAHINLLQQENTFTVTTAHQPSLFLGPLYFLYKAISAINLAKQWSETLHTAVVPIYVLGSEDHDLAELNHANVFGKRLEWNPNENGAVGGMSTESLGEVLSQLGDILGESEPAKLLFDRIKNAYTARATFAEATQALLHDVFGRFGLVVLNMSDPRLKRHFIPIMREELTKQTAQRLVNDTIAQLNAAGFKSQASPREINLFYLMPGLRERIVLEGDTYKVLNTDLTFSVSEMRSLLEAHPERFSPNVVLRPLFQEIILPNLAYVGGGGELAYWLERKSLFEYFKVPFPVLVRRNSVLWLDKDAEKKLEKFGFSPTEFFGDTEALLKKFINANATGEVSLEKEIIDLREIMDRLTAKAKAVDPTLEKAVRAEEVKMVGALEQWQNRLVRAEKAKHETTINQIRALKEKLFPNNGLQERTDNWITYFQKYGDDWLDVLVEQLDPQEAGFVVLHS